VEVERRAFAATWVAEETGEIVGTTLGDTMCWHPRRPWAITIANEGDTLIVPCGECPGCLEFLRRRLADRLKSKYGSPSSASSTSTKRARDSSATVGATFLERAAITDASSWEKRAGARPGKFVALCIVRIWYPQELQVELSAKLHRRRGLELEPGFFRLGTDSIALLARSKAALPRLLRRLGLRHRVEPVRLSRGRRAWRALTAGILVARAVYGEEVKRWYMRGLPAAERMRWDVVKRAMQKPWRRRTGARVRTGSKIILVPPAIWSMDGDRFKEYREAAAAASSPEQAMANRRRLAQIVAGASAHLNFDAPAQPALSREAVRRFYAGMAERKRQSATETSAAALNPSTLLGGGLRSSRHSGLAPPVEIPPDEELAQLKRTGIGLLLNRIEDKRAREELYKRWQRLSFELELRDWTERMKGKIRGG
jgi:hypothetical protein